MSTMTQAAEAFDTLSTVFPAGSEQRQRIAALKGVSEDEPGLDAFLLVCIVHDLDPALGGLDLLPNRVPGVDGSEAEVDGYSPYAGRDVLLGIARKHPDYTGIQFAAVRAKDRFGVEWKGGDDDPRVTHKFAPKPKTLEAPEEGGNVAAYVHEWRGPIIGAWARLKLRGKADTFHYIELHEHRQDSAYWDTYESDMAVKAAQSYVCRIGVGITGVVPSDELAVQRPDDTPAADITSAAWEGVEWGGDPELAAALQDAVDEANRMDPFSWSEAKVQMVLAGRSDEERQRILKTLWEENDSRRERMASEQATAEGPAGEDPPAPAGTPAVFEVSANEVTKGDALIITQDGEDAALTVARVEAADGGERRIFHFDGTDRTADLAGDDPVKVIGGPTYERVQSVAAGASVEE